MDCISPLCKNLIVQRGYFSSKHALTLQNNFFPCHIFLHWSTSQEVCCSPGWMALMTMVSLLFVVSLLFHLKSIFTGKICSMEWDVMNILSFASHLQTWDINERMLPQSSFPACSEKIKQDIVIHCKARRDEKIFFIFSSPNK